MRHWRNTDAPVFMDGNETVVATEISPDGSLLFYVPVADCECGFKCLSQLATNLKPLNSSARAMLEIAKRGAK